MCRCVALELTVGEPPASSIWALVIAALSVAAQRPSADGRAGGIVEDRAALLAFWRHADNARVRDGRRTMRRERLRTGVDISAFVDFDADVQCSTEHEKSVQQGAEVRLHESVR